MLALLYAIHYTLKAMQHCYTIEELRSCRAHLQGRVGFVPTMGALHEGHIALMKTAKATCDHVIASIFVNPKQFGVNEDFSRYPRTLEQDSHMLSKAGIDALFAPDAQEIYPDHFSTSVLTTGMDSILCGAHRPGHFAGVTTIVALLFSLVRPDTAFFGEKDYQQLAIIKRMNQDLRLVDSIVGVPTIREKDGLALSSRNRYLTEEQRQMAPLLYSTLQSVARTATDGNLVELLHQHTDILQQAGFKVDYLEARNADTLQLSQTTRNARLFVAARLGTTRLIDNIPFDRQNI